MDFEDIDIAVLKMEATKGLRQEAAKAKEASAVLEHGPIPKDKVTWVAITSIPIPNEFGIPVESLPETENINKMSIKNAARKITNIYYNCHICGHSTQNKPSMITHT